MSSHDRDPPRAIDQTQIVIFGAHDDGHSRSRRLRTRRKNVPPSPARGEARLEEEIYSDDEAGEQKQLP